MAAQPARSAEFLEVHNARSRHRSRSQGHADILEQQEEFDRYSKDRAMKRYHEAKQARQYTGNDRLFVPSIPTPGRTRSKSINDNDEEPFATREFNVREVRPSASLEDRAQDREREIPFRPKTHQKRPSIKVEIHQDNPSAPISSTRSPFGSKSGAQLSELHLQHLTIKGKLSEVSDVCGRSAHIEGASPEDLTFSKIAETVKGYDQSLKIWSYEVNLEKMTRVDPSKRKVVDHASRTMEKLFERASQLSEECKVARPRDLKCEPLPDEDEVDAMSGDDSDSALDVTESLGFAIKMHLNAINLHIQTLSRLTRAIQEATPDARDEVMAVEKLTSEVDKFFGSAEALRTNSIDRTFAGGKALEEARYTASQGRSYVS